MCNCITLAALLMFLTRLVLKLVVKTSTKKQEFLPRLNLNCGNPNVVSRKMKICQPELGFYRQNSDAAHINLLLNNLKQLHLNKLLSDKDSK